MAQAKVETLLTARDAGLSGALSSGVASIRRFGTAASSAMRIGAVALASLYGSAVAAGAVFVRAFMQQEDAVKGLESALRATGQAAAGQSEKLQALAGNIQRLTTYGDEALLETMTLALNMGVSADRMEDVTKAAVGLSKAYGFDLRQSMRMVQMAQEGNVMMMRRMIPELKNAKDNADALRMVNEAATRGWVEAQDASKTMSGQLTQLKNRWGDLTEVLGAALAPALTRVIEVGGQVVTWAEENASAIADYMQRIFDVVGAIVDGFVPALGWAVEVLGRLGGTVVDSSGGWEGFVENVKLAVFWLTEHLVKGVQVAGQLFVYAFTAIEVVVTRWKDVMALAVTSAAYLFVKRFEEMRWFLTEAMPRYLEWFLDNFVNIFETLALAVGSILNGMWDNMKMFFTNVWKLLNGEEADWKWTSLLAGFESTISELPAIAERIPGALESGLRDSMGQIGAAIGGDIVTTAEERIRKLGLDRPIELNAKAVVDTKPADDALARVRDEQIKLQMSDKAKAKADSGKAAFEDLGALWKRIQTSAATRSPVEQAAIDGAKDQKRAADAAEAAREDQKRVVTATEESRDVLKRMLENPKLAVLV